MCPAITVGVFGQVPVKANGLELGGGHQGQAQRSSSLGSWALDPCLPCGKAGAKTQGEEGLGWRSQPHCEAQEGPGRWVEGGQACDGEAEVSGTSQTLVGGGRGDLSALPWLKNAKQHLGFLVSHLPSEY